MWIQRSVVTRRLVVLFQDEQLALTPDAGERASVQGTWPQSVEGGEVLRRRVALVADESVLGKAPVRVEHETVARDLGDDRRRRDAGAPRVAVDEIPLRAGEVAQRHEVGDD